MNMEKTRRVIENKCYGFEMVRVLMCFGVVLCHFWRTPSRYALINHLEILKHVAVPVFMMISFYLVSRNFFDVRLDTVKKRMFRLIWPHVVWTVVYWVIYYKFERVAPADLFWQFFTGHSPRVNATMWFQINMIILSALFFGVFYVLKSQKAMIAIVFFAAVAVVFLYSGLNNRLFGDLRYELAYSIGRVAEMMPYAVLGVCFAYVDVKKYLLKHRVLSLSVAVALWLLIVWTEKRVPFGIVGVGYANAYILLKGLVIFVVGMLFPLSNLPGMVKKVLDVTTRYTLGIYCIHRLVEWALFTMPLGNKLCDILGVGNRSFTICVVLYVVCYLCSALISLIPLKIVKQLVS